MFRHTAPRRWHFDMAHAQFGERIDVAWITANRSRSFPLWLPGVRSRQKVEPRGRPYAKRARLSNGFAEALARRAVPLDPTDGESRATLSEAMAWSRGDYEGAIKLGR